MTLKVSRYPKAFHKKVLVDPKCWGLWRTPTLRLSPGAEFINSELGMTLADATVEQLGTCRLGKKHKRLRSKNRGLPKKQWDFTIKRFWEPKDSPNKKHKSSPTKKKNRQKWRILAREQFGFSITESNFISKPDRFHWQILLRVWMTMN